ncbi:MAG: hypothetical protein J6I71_07595 [Campylobacter sp.]|nr:hypothetical protein [Campylobacter sp.]MBP3676326.1 hypothetical protein [Campylobacter sp.]
MGFFRGGELSTGTAQAGGVNTYLLSTININSICHISDKLKLYFSL